MIKNVKKLLRLNIAKGKLVNAMGLLSHVVTDSLGSGDVDDIDSKEYVLIISILERWRDKIETEESIILADCERDTEEKA